MKMISQGKIVRIAKDNNSKNQIDNTISKINKIKDQANEAKIVIDNLKNEATKSKTDIDSIKNQATQSKTGIDNIKDGATQSKKEIDKLKDGATQSKTGIDNIKDEVNELKGKVIELLEKTTGASLAHSYDKTSKSHHKIQNRFIIFFIISLVGIITTGAINIVHNESPDKFDLLYSFFKFIPIYTAFIWLALFSSKGISENKRLQEEYTHKKNVTVLFEGFKEKVTAPDSEAKKEQIKNLFDSVVKMSSENPSSTLEKSMVKIYLLLN